MKECGRDTMKLYLYNTSGPEFTCRLDFWARELAKLMFLESLPYVQSTGISFTSKIFFVTLHSEVTFLTHCEDYKNNSIIQSRADICHVVS